MSPASSNRSLRRGKGKVGKKGVVREPEIHLEVLQNYVENAHAAGFKVLDVTFSPIKGPEGNIEFLGYLAKAGRGAHSGSGGGCPSGT